MLDTRHIEAARLLQAEPPNRPDVRVDRVLSLRAAIASGSYRISADRLAETLIQSMRRPS